MDGVQAMQSGHPADGPRRNVVGRALAIGALGAGSSSLVNQNVWALGRVPGPLLQERSTHRLRGDARLNGRTANIESIVQPGNRVTTGPASQVVSVVESRAFVLSSSSALESQGAKDKSFVRGLHRATGALLSVFGRGRAPRINAPVATIGIRGTSVYLESEEDRSYGCTCYGEAELRWLDNPSSAETVRTEHHNAPRYMLAAANSGELVRPARFKHHTDEELSLIGTLVGRERPFSVFKGGVQNPKTGLVIVLWP